MALYFRQIIIITVSLFTSRIILQTLGVTDFGIKNVVGGIVVMMSFLTNSLAGTTQRFLSIELGKGDFENLKKIFSNSLSLHIIFILLVLIIAETLGLWFLQNKLVIPPEREYAAFWVFQLSIISFAIGVFFSPFDGAVRTHEKFDFYAKVSVFDVIMRLVIVYLLSLQPYDKLIMLSFFNICVSVIEKIIIYIYCFKNFEECRIKFTWEKSNIKKLLGYNSYTVLGSISYIIRFQVINVILNLYYGPIMNAAQAIANTVFSQISSFSNNAAIATQPQIIMSYAQNDRTRLWSLIVKSSRLYYYLLLILALPFLFEINTALYLWLGSYPEYTAIFTQLFLLEALQRVLTHSITAANSAVGKLREITLSSILCRLLILLCAIFIGIKQLSPIYIYIIGLFFHIICFIYSLIIVLKIQLSFSIHKYVKEVIFPITKTSLIAASIPFILHYFFSNSVISSVLIGLFTLIWSSLTVFYIGLNFNEKLIIVNKLPPPLRKLILIKNNMVNNE